MVFYNYLIKDIIICFNDEKIILYEFIMKNEKIICKKNEFKIMLICFYLNYV